MMFGLGTWLVKVESMFFKGEATVNIADRSGEYDITLDVDADFEMPSYKIYDINVDGNTLTATAEVSLLPGKKIEVSFTIDETETLTGLVKIPFMGKIKVKDGHRI